jgi:cytoskeletal protein CcmA (bactofilin family)
MFRGKKGLQAEKDQIATLPKAATLSVATKIAAQPGSSSKQPEATSCISSATTVVGKIVVDGSIMVHGHVEGELQASDVVICEGAQVEGNIVAKELAVDGRVAGTIHAVRVKLRNTAVVEGDIFHRLLTIDENARFEGMSQRENSLADSSASVQRKV